MIRSLLFGGAEGYGALKDKLDGLEMDLGETCSGEGCKPWQETRDGKKRFEKLKKINRERKEKGLSHVS